jgi:hypothetical protein
MNFTAAFVALTLFSTSASAVTCELICAAEWCDHARTPQPRLANPHQDGVPHVSAQLEHEHGSAANRSTVAAPDGDRRSRAERCRTLGLTDADGPPVSLEPDDCRGTIDAVVAAVRRDTTPQAGIVPLPRTASPIVGARAAVFAAAPCGSHDRLSGTVPLRI